MKVCVEILSGAGFENGGRRFCHLSASPQARTLRFLLDAGGAKLEAGEAKGGTQPDNLECYFNFSPITKRITWRLDE